MSAPIEVVIRWIEEDAFEIVEPPQAGKALDGNRKIGLSPMETLLASLAGCMGIDVVMILLKMRSQLETLQIGVRGHRNDDPPRYFNRLELEFQLRGVLTESKRTGPSTYPSKNTAAFSTLCAMIFKLSAE